MAQKTKRQATAADPKPKKSRRKGTSPARAKKRADSQKKGMSIFQQVLVVIGVALLVLVTVFFLVLRRGAQVSISENAIGSLFSPVQNAFTTTTQAVRGFFTRWRDYDALQEAYDDLYFENQRLELQMVNAEEALGENERLKQLLDAQDRYETLDPVYARVIARDPGRWFNTFSINRGTTNGISVGMAVCTGDGLVGRVYEVGLNYAKVLCIIDPRSAVACLVSRTRDNGVMRGQVSESSGNPDCYVYYLPNVNNVVPGDTVITSGTDSLYPKGLAIGEVTAVSREGGSDGNYVVITPFADFQHVEEVLILRQVIETDSEVLAPVPTPTQRPIVTPTPTPMLPGASQNGEAGATIAPDEWQYPTPTPETSAAPGSSSAPLRYENLPEDSWAES